MQRQSFPRAVLSLAAVIVMVGSLTMLSCPGEDNVKPAAIEDLRLQTFILDDGAAFGLPNQTVTLAVGDFVDSGKTVSFVLSFGDETATGTLTTGSCMLNIATSTILEIDAGATLILDPCEIDTDAGVLTVANAAIGANTRVSSRPRGCDDLCSGECRPTGSGGQTP